jgi:hypothetical protein
MTYVPNPDQHRYVQLVAGSEAAEVLKPARDVHKPAHGASR